MPSRSMVAEWTELSDQRGLVPCDHRLFVCQNDKGTDAATVRREDSRLGAIAVKIDPRFSYRSEDVVATLERVCARTDYPKTIRVDQGSEFVSRDLDLRAYARGVTFELVALRPPSALTLWQAEGQCLYRSLQRTLPQRMPERPLVPDTCRCARLDGALAPAADGIARQRSPGYGQPIDERDQEGGVSLVGVHPVGSGSDRPDPGRSTCTMRYPFSSVLAHGSLLCRIEPKPCSITRTGASRGPKSRTCKRTRRSRRARLARADQAFRAPLASGRVPEPEGQGGDPCDKNQKQHVKHRFPQRSIWHCEFFEVKRVPCHSAIDSFPSSGLDRMTQTTLGRHD